MASRPTASPSDPGKALAIGNDLHTRENLRSLLAGVEGVAPLLDCETGEGLRVFYAERPDLVLLDLAPDPAAGRELLVRIREMSDVPVIALSDDGAAQRAELLRGGADDCLTKPFERAELLARIEGLLRRSRMTGGPVAVLEDAYVRIDRVRYRVEVLGQEVALTPTEFRMLSTFAENPGRVLGHGQLLELVWGGGFRERDEVKLYVSYLRRKLGDAAGINPVETVRGIGYRYQPHRVP